MARRRVRRASTDKPRDATRQRDARRARTARRHARDARGDLSLAFRGARAARGRARGRARDGGGGGTGRDGDGKRRRTRRRDAREAVEPERELQRARSRADRESRGAVDGAVDLGAHARAEPRRARARRADGVLRAQARAGAAISGDIGEEGGRESAVARGRDVGGADGGDDRRGVSVGLRGERALGTDARGVRAADHAGVGGGDELCDRIGAHDAREGAGRDRRFRGNGHRAARVRNFSNGRDEFFGHLSLAVADEFVRRLRRDARRGDENVPVSIAVLIPRHRRGRVRRLAHRDSGVRPTRRLPRSRVRLGRRRLRGMGLVRLRPLPEFLGRRSRQGRLAHRLLRRPSHLHHRSQSRVPSRASAVGSRRRHRRHHPRRLFSRARQVRRDARRDASRRALALVRRIVFVAPSLHLIRA